MAYEPGSGQDGAMTAVAMSIAGSDPSGGAGVQADLKTFHQHGVYGTAAITLLTVQNTLGVQRVELVSPELVGQQVAAVLSDLSPRAIKTGALGSASTIERIAQVLQGSDAPLVVDPVGFSKNHHALTDASARDVLLSRLLPRVALITPNLDEMAWLTQRSLTDEASLRDAVKALVDAGPRAVLLKGGHRQGAPIDLLWSDGLLHELTATRIETPHTHGVGCTLSAAITARLALKESLLDAVTHAKQWITEAIATAPGLGEGQGPVNHFAKISP